MLPEPPDNANRRIPTASRTIPNIDKRFDDISREVIVAYLLRCQQDISEW
jgi:hypothetical protein